MYYLESYKQQMVIGQCLSKICPCRSDKILPKAGHDDQIDLIEKAIIVLQLKICIVLWNLNIMKGQVTDKICSP